MAGHTARAWSSDVIFRCEPADCEVWLDGVPFGSCLDFSGDPKGLSLSEGMHKVEVKKAGFWSYETYVDSGGARAALTVKLSPH